MVGTTAEPIFSPPEATSVRLTGISWDTYERLLGDLEGAGQPLKLIYDCGALEIEMPTKIHEIVKTFVSHLLEYYLTSTAVNFLSLGEATWKQFARTQGLESDACYYVQNVAAVGDGESIDLGRDPPPDLAIEVEVTAPLINKLPIYAALGVRELWHIRTPDTVEFFILDDSGVYRTIERSLAIPAITPDAIGRFIRLRKSVGNSEAARRATAEFTQVP